MVSARRYLKTIRDIKYRLEVAYDELKIVKRDISSLGAIDYSKPNIQSGGRTDLSDNIIRTSEIEKKINRKITRLLEMREEARERINSMQNQKLVSILISYYINGKNVKEICIDDEEYPSKATIYNWIKKAEREFEINNYKWLKSLEKDFKNNYK